jgi:hypothetical protein
MNKDEELYLANEDTLVEDTERAEEWAREVERREFELRELKTKEPHA